MNMTYFNRLHKAKSLSELYQLLRNLDEEHDLANKLGRMVEKDDVSFVWGFPTFSDDDLGQVTDDYVELSWDPYFIIRLEKNPEGQWGFSCVGNVMPAQEAPGPVTKVKKVPKQAQAA